ALLATPPGWLQDAFWAGGGSSIGPFASMEAVTSSDWDWRTEMRSPGSFCSSFAPNRLGSSGRLGALSPAHPPSRPVPTIINASATQQETRTPDSLALCLIPPVSLRLSRRRSRLILADEQR